MPKVSVITPCYNGEQFIGRTIESVRAQTFTDWEHIIVDDGSEADLHATVSPYLVADSRVRMLRQPNGGMSRARNAGFAACSDDSAYLLFLDADDCIEPEMVATLVDYLDAHPNVGMVYCDRVEIDSHDVPLEDQPTESVVRYIPGHRSLEQLGPDVPDTPFISLFFPVCSANPSVSLLRKSTYEQAGGWDELILQHCEDRDLRLRIALLSAVHYIPLKLVRRRIHSSNYSMSGAMRIARMRAERRFARKWAIGAGLTPPQKAIVREARHWYSKRLPHIWFTWGSDALQRRNVVGAAWCYLNGVTSFAVRGTSALREWGTSHAFWRIDVRKGR